MASEALNAAAVVAAQYWPLIAGAAIVMLAVAGVCALFIAATRVHSGPEDETGNVINFEKWRD